MDSKEIPSEQVLDRIAKQLLARPEHDWTAHRARQLTGNAMRRTGCSMQKANFNHLVSSVYRVGLHIPATKDLNKSVPYDWEPLRQQLLSAIECDTGPSLDSDFFHKLYADIGGFSYESTRDVDWVEKLNNALAVSQESSFNYGLEEKLIAANIIESFLEDRLISLALAASKHQDASIRACASAIKEAFSSRSSHALCHVSPDVPATNDSKRLSPNELKQLKATVDLHFQDDFISTLQAASPCVQRSLFNRWQKLKENPIAEALWTKHIRGADSRIREMKFVSDGSHFRALYSVDDGKLLTFGLRRDLKNLISMVLRQR